jgi:AraC-like DNA-binding protein
VHRPAYSFVRDFEPAPPQPLCVDRHYLLAASRGALRLEVDGTSWSLPPARAALIRAGVSIEVTIPQRVTTASVLFSTTFAPSPPANLAVVDLTPLARALIAECARWGEEGEPLDDYALAMFRALAEATWALAEHPSPAHMPTGRSTEVRRALAITADRLADDPRLVDIAGEIGLAPRSLARRFEQELGMTWRAALRRLRVLRAIEHLAGTDHSVTRIAADVGYSSMSAFQVAFRDLIGQTPSDYRAGFAAPRPAVDAASDGV